MTEKLMHAQGVWIKVSNPPADASREVWLGGGQSLGGRTKAPFKCRFYLRDKDRTHWLEEPGPVEYVPPPLPDPFDEWRFLHWPYSAEKSSIDMAKRAYYAAKGIPVPE